jgi:hypothetical protein
MENWENSKAFMKRLIDRSCTIHKIFQRGKSLAEARNNTKEMKSSLQLTSCICATRFSMSQVNEFKKLISSLHVCIATYTELHQTNATFELKTWEMCGQDFKPSELSPFRVKPVPHPFLPGSNFKKYILLRSLLLCLHSFIQTMIS